MATNKHINKFPAWHEVETQIRKEIEWLRQSIDTFNMENSSEPKTCPDCMLRKISELIVSGNILAREITKSKNLKSFWINSKKIKVKENYHGSAWHSDMIKRIEIHFLAKRFQVEREPNLTWGRADLGIYKTGQKTLFIEVGTTSLRKLYINLRGMKNFVYLIVPNESRLIEFTDNSMVK